MVIEKMLGIQDIKAMSDEELMQGMERGLDREYQDRVRESGKNGRED